MKNVLKFKEWQNFNFVTGKVKEINDKSVFVNIGFDNLIACDNGNLKYKLRDNVVVLLGENNQGRLLAVLDSNKVSLLIVDKDVKEGSRIS